MDIKKKLSERIKMEDIDGILEITHTSDSKKQELYNILIGKDEKMGCQAAWIFTHFSSQDNKWLYKKQNELIDILLICKHGGKRRLILSLLYKQPFMEPIRVDFLDFCLERIITVKELAGVQSLCIKIAYELCRPFPELIQELKSILEMMEGDLSPAILNVRKNILKAIQNGKSLQKI